MPEQFFVQKMTNGLTLLGQRMDAMTSAAATLFLPAGASHDPEPLAGAGAVLAEWCFRGAGDRDNRQFNDALDSLGCQHQESVLSDHMMFSAAMLGRNLPQVLRIYADVLRRPRLEDDAFEPCRALAVQDLTSLEDEPAQKANMLLREKFFPEPLGRCILGRSETLQALTAVAVREHAKKHFTPAGAILAVAGLLDWNEFCTLAGDCLGGWTAPPPPAVAVRPAAGGVTHIRKESAQTHITLAHKAVTASDPRFYAARMAETVLSGGMSSRLFTEVREKRGLVYHVSSHYQSLKGHAGMFTYAGTVPAKAQETFEVTVNELRRLGEGIQPEEMARARTQLKSSLVMQGESTSARSSSLASDWYHLGRLRGLHEISEAIDRVTVEEVLAYLREFPARDFTVLVIGPEPVDVGGLR